MCCTTLGLLLQALNDADPNELKDVPATEVLQLINWADGYAWAMHHHSLIFPTPARVLETGIRIVFGLPSPIEPLRQPRDRTPLEARRAQWTQKPKAIRRAVMDRDGLACRHCSGTSGLTIDHIIPLSRGGSDDVDNLQVLCKSCNSSKGPRTMAEWLGAAVRLLCGLSLASYYAGRDAGYMAGLLASTLDAPPATVAGAGE